VILALLMPDPTEMRSCQHPIDLAYQNGLPTPVTPKAQGMAS
jgi:hypothetical protein